jgi:hypothetical protein
MPFRRAPNCATGPFGGKTNLQFTTFDRIRAPGVHSIDDNEAWRRALVPSRRARHVARLGAPRVDWRRVARRHDPRSHDRPRHLPAARSPRGCAITATVAAFGWDFLDYQTFAPLPLVWTILVAATALVALAVARHPRPRAMLLPLTWTAVASAFRYLLPPSTVGREVATMLTVFVVLALILSLVTAPRLEASAR